MSASPIVTDLPRPVLKRKVVRYAFGILLAVTLAFGINWPASFLAIVLANVFLQGNKPSIKMGIDFIVAAILAVILALLLSNFLLQYRNIYIIIIGLVLFYLFYAKDSQISPILKIWFLLAILIIPLMSLKSIVIGEIVGQAIIIGAIVALLVVWIAHAIFPDNDHDQGGGHSGSHASIPPTDHERFITALKRTVVVYPVVIMFFFFNLQSDVLILIYIAIFSSVPGISQDLSIGKTVFLGCVTGGIITFFLYELLVLVPVFSFMLVLFFLAALFIGDQIFQNKKYAVYIKAGFSAIIIVFGSAVGNDKVDAGGKAFLRVIQVGIVVLYLIVAFGLLEKWFPTKKQSANNN